MLRVTRVSTPVTAIIRAVSWRGLRCRVEASAGSAGLRADVRTKPADAGSSLVTTPKELPADGNVSLVVAEEGDEGSAAVVVLLDAQGRVVAKAPTTVGEEG